MLFLVQGQRFYDLKTFLSDSEKEKKKTQHTNGFFELLTACFHEKRISHFHEVWQKVNKNASCCDWLQKKSEILEFVFGFFENMW